MSDIRDKHNLNRSQHGFAKGTFCLTNLLSSYSKVYEVTENGDSCDILYLDFSRVFDKGTQDKWNGIRLY